MIAANGSVKKKPQKEIRFQTLEEALEWANERKKEKQLTSLYIAPKIPVKKSRNAIKRYAKEIVPEDILFLYDGTVFGSGKNGILMTKNRLYWGQDRKVGSASFDEVEMKEMTDSSMLVIKGVQMDRVVMARAEQNLEVFRKLMRYLGKKEQKEEAGIEKNQEIVSR